MGHLIEDFTHRIHIHVRLLDDDPLILAILFYKITHCPS